MLAKKKASARKAMKPKTKKEILEKIGELEEWKEECAEELSQSIAVDSNTLMRTIDQMVKIQAKIDILYWVLNETILDQ